MKTFNKMLAMLMPLTLLVAYMPTHAQTPVPTPAPILVPSAPAQKPCSAPENRQFDFWIGDWDVTTPDGKPAGTNLITPMLGGCVLHEQWKGNGGFVGESFNAWDARRKFWHQTWVDGSGSVLMLDGKFENGSMTLSDRTLHGKANRDAINEIVWTPNADSSVRQHWRTSADGGKTWTTAFDGKYVKANRPQPKL